MKKKTFEFTLCKECQEHSALMRIHIPLDKNLVYNGDNLEGLKNQSTLYSISDRVYQFLPKVISLICDKCYQKKVLEFEFVKVQTDKIKKQPTNKTILEIINYGEVQQRWERVQELYNEAVKAFSSKIQEHKFDVFIKRQKDMMKMNLGVELDSYILGLSEIMSKEVEQDKTKIKLLEDAQFDFKKDFKKQIKEGLIHREAIDKAFKENTERFNQSLSNKVTLLYNMTISQMINIKPYIDIK
ncbi:hypothetical protein OXYTRIMIC_801 [Oxytricha trifallax]|uniref:Uncharacterized protein n=1 Tax=Oxytricha trifallax TaxID=1172189 RepID=A0A073HYH0_9SPIT|nr:hypothetical protein OXYTRIMIC_801 [Oxytricha trifallax]